MAITVKSSHELEKIRRASEVVVRTHEAICQYIQPGTTTLTLDKIVEGLILRSGAKPSYKGYYDFPYCSYFDVNEEIVHSLPSSKPLADGDIVTASFGVVLDGYHSFQSITHPVGRLTPNDAVLLSVTNEALESARWLFPVDLYRWWELSCVPVGQSHNGRCLPGWWNNGTGDTVDQLEARWLLRVDAQETAHHHCACKQNKVLLYR